MAKNRFTVFEHESLFLEKGEYPLTKVQLSSLQLYNPKNKLPYYSLIHDGIKFCEHVGVIQIGNLIIEVLPKADKFSNEYSKDEWRKILINILKVVGTFEVKDTSTSSLKIKPNTILDLYFEKFVMEVEYLIRNGLNKKYRKSEGNRNSLKGALLFNKHLQKNLTHAERFYVKFNTYDVVHVLHRIIFKAIKVLRRINTNVDLDSRIGAMELLFPEMPDIKITESLFDKIIYNRKTNIYKNAVEISKLLLLFAHPDLVKGRHNVLALMFDMNKLWEKFIYVSLRKKLDKHIVTAQNSTKFWRPVDGNYRPIRADILIKNENNTAVLDTKWKNINGDNPSSDDLQQMFVYHKYYKAKKVALIYPGVWDRVDGEYEYTSAENPEKNKCSLISLNVNNDINKWQEEISEKINAWIDSN